MTDTTTSSPTVLVLGGTGKTARRLVPLLRAGGATARTAARSGGDVRFDWDDPTTYAPALAGATAAYLVAPGARVEYRSEAAAFLDAAEAAGVAHVTLLSARGVDHLPDEVPIRAVELEVLGRSALTSTVLRPGWFLQNFTEGVFVPVDGAIVAPAGTGREAFVHTSDIAEVAAATLLDPAAHAGAGYTLTGPEALTFADVAARIAAASGRPVEHVDADPAAWEKGLVDAGLPADYAGLLGGLVAVLRESTGAATTDDVARITGHEPRGIAAVATDPEALAAWGAV